MKVHKSPSVALAFLHGYAQSLFADPNYLWRLQDKARNPHLYAWGTRPKRYGAIKRHRFVYAPRSRFLPPDKWLVAMGSLVADQGHGLPADSPRHIRLAVLDFLLEKSLSRLDSMRNEESTSQQKTDLRDDREHRNDTSNKHDAQVRARPSHSRAEPQWQPKGSKLQGAFV